MAALVLAAPDARSQSRPHDAPAPRSAASDRIVTLAVEAVGVLPGFRIADASQYLALQMAKAEVNGWAFTPARVGAPPASDRIQWRFRLNPYAGGGIREIIPMPALQRRFGAHRLITVEVRLYLDGDYETMTFGQATIEGGEQDRDLAALVASVTQRLLGETGAYRAVGASPAPPGPNNLGGALP